MKRPGERGPFGNWLRTAREQRYETQREALAAMRKLAGLTISPAEYSQWESGSRVPREDNPKRRALYDFFGSEPQPEAPPASGSEVAAAIREAIAPIVGLIEELRTAERERRAILEELRAERLRREAWEQGFLEEMRALRARDETQRAARGGGHLVEPIQ